MIGQIAEHKSMPVIDDSWLRSLAMDPGCHITALDRTALHGAQKSLDDVDLPNRIRLLVLRQRFQQFSMDATERTVAHHQYVVTRQAARHNGGYQCAQILEALRFRAK